MYLICWYNENCLLDELKHSSPRMCLHKQSCRILLQCVYYPNWTGENSIAHCIQLYSRLLIMNVFLPYKRYSQQVEEMLKGAVHPADPDDMEILRLQSRNSIEDKLGK